MTKDKEIMVRIEAQMAYLHPPKDMQEAVLREQIETKIQAMATNMEKGVVKLLDAMIASVQQRQKHG